MGASAQPSGGQNSQFFRLRCQSYTGSYRTSNGSVSPAFWWPKELALQPQMPELYRRLLGQQLERRHSPAFWWPQPFCHRMHLYTDSYRDYSWKGQPGLLVAKTASPSATEGIGRQVATGTIAGRGSPAFGWPKQPALLPQKALVYR
jgi:hypothetical protein